MLVAEDVSLFSVFKESGYFHSVFFLDIASSDAGELRFATNVDLNYTKDNFEQQKATVA